MTAELAPRTVDLPAVLSRWLVGKSPRTQASYAKSLRVYADFVGAPDAASAVGALLAGTRGEAALSVEGFKGAMLAKGLSASTVNWRIAAIASFVEAARVFGACEWTLDVKSVKPDPRRRDVALTWAQYEEMVEKEPSTRNRAILRLLGDRALRRAEVATLSLADFLGESVDVLGKGCRERETIAVNHRTREAIMAWLRSRGRAPGPLFGIGVDAIHEVVRKAGARIGRPDVHPHQLRHAGATRALDLTGGDVRRVQRFLRHKSPVTTMVYDDKRNDVATGVAHLVGKE